MMTLKAVSGLEKLDIQDHVIRDNGRTQAKKIITQEQQLQRHCICYVLKYFYLKWVKIKGQGMCTVLKLGYTKADMQK